MLASNNDQIFIRETIIDRNKCGIFDNKKIVIFGCTLYAKNIRNALLECELVLHAIIDNDKRKRGRGCLGVDVYLPEEYCSKNNDSVYIICSKYKHEMIEQLINCGVDTSQILVIDISENGDNEGYTAGDFEKNKLKVLAGYKKYEDIITKYPKAKKIFLCPYQGTGDVYLSCLYLPEYIRKNGIDDYAILVIGNNCKRVAELFNIKFVESVSSEEKDLLLKAWEFLGDEIVKIKPLLYWGWRTKRYLYANKHSQITFSDMFRFDVFGLDDKAKIKRPHVNPKSDYAAHLFEKLKLKKGKTVIISPYAGSFVSEISMKEWNYLVDRLISSGYLVCTNSYGDKEPPLANTVAIQFPYNEVVNVLNYAGTFIGVRSGLCDIASAANCKLIILYEQGFSASDIEYFGLKNMGLSDDAIEMEYDGRNSFMDELISNIQ